MALDNDWLEIGGNCLTVIADALLLLAATDELKKEAKGKSDFGTIDPARVDLLAGWVVLLSDALLAFVAIREIEAKRRGEDPPEFGSLESIGNWGCFLGDGMTIVAAGMEG